MRNCKYFDNPMADTPTRTADIPQNTVRRALDTLEVDPKRTPTIAVVNGYPVLECDWDGIQAGDIHIYNLPADPVTVGGALLSVFAPKIATALGFQGVIGHALATATIVIGGSYILGQIFPPAAATDYAGNSIQQSPTYSVTARGNRYRPGEPITEVFGKTKVYPTYWVPPYVRYESGEQYLYEVFHVSAGDCVLSNHMIGDSEVGSVKDGFNQWIQGDINNGTSAPRGFYRMKHIVKNAQRELSSATGKTKYYGIAEHNPNMPHDIEVDIIAPNGLTKTNGTNLTVTLRIWYKKGVSVGQPITQKSGGTYGQSTPQYKDFTITGDGTKVVRVTLPLTIQSATAEGIRLEWISDDGNAQSGRDKIYLSAIRKLVGNVVAPTGHTFVLRKTKATEISQGATGKYSVVAHRKLPPYNKATAPPRTTNAIADVVVYIMRSWHGGVQLDMTTLAQLHTDWTTRSDTINGVFDTATTLWQAVAKVLTVGRTQPVRLWDSVTFVRDTHNTTPHMMFNMHNIAPDSLKIHHRLTGEETADAIKVYYQDADHEYTEKSVSYAITGSPNNRQIELRLPFITNRAHALREAKFKARENYYRRKTVSFTIPTPPIPLLVGSTHILQHPLIGAVNTQGFIVDYDQTANTLTLSAPVDWHNGKTYAIRITDTKGKVSPPIPIMEDPHSDTIIHLATALSFNIIPQLAGNGTPSAFVINETKTQNHIIRISSAKPIQQGDKIEITAFFDTAKVHQD